MATLIRRSDALKRINRLEESAVASGNRAGAEWIVKAYNAIMSCRVEERVFCQKCGKALKIHKEDRDDQDEP